MLMVFQRELRVGSRRRATYWTRTIAAAIGLWIIWLMGDFQNGHYLFFYIVFGAFAACLLEGIRRAGTSVAEEKVEGTFPLLLLTKLSGRVFLIGKFGIVFLASLQLAIALIPLLAVPVLMGGVTASDIVYNTIALLHILSLSVAIGVAFSSVNSTPGGAMACTATTLILGAIISAIFLAVIPNLDSNLFAYVNPLTPFAYERTGPSAPYFSSLLICQLVAFQLLRHRGRHLANDWRREQDDAIRIAQFYYAPPASLPEPAPASPATSTSTPPPPVPIRPRSTNRFYAPAWFEGHPIVWLSLREMGMHWEQKVFTVAYAVIAFFICFADDVGYMIGGMFAVLLIVLIAVGSPRLTSLLRQSGLLELLLTTPIVEKEILAGHMKAIRKIFLWPGLLLWAGMNVLLLRQYFEKQFNFSNLTAGLYVMSGLALALWGAPWIGTWCGLKAKTPLQATIWSLVFILFVPRLAFCYLGDAPYFLLAGIIARNSILNHFRKLRAQSA